MATATKKKAKKAQADEALRREKELEYARSLVLEDLILGTDTDDEGILCERASEWLEESGFGADALDHYDDDAATCIADHVYDLSPEEVMEQLLEEYDEEDIEELVREKMRANLIHFF